MSLQNVVLEFVSIASVSGSAMTFPATPDSPEGVGGFKARFGLNVNAASLNEPTDLRFTVQMKFEALGAKDDAAFFKIELVGHFKAKETEDLDPWINSEEGAFSLGAMIFPYLRNLSKPMLEGLGAAQVDFPWSSPEITKIQEAKPKKKKR